MIELPISKDMCDLSPIIVSNYTILHFDVVPILFFGNNASCEFIVGSILCEEEDGEQSRYIHTIVSASDFVLFLQREIPYRELIEKSDKVYLLDKDINDNVIALYKDVPMELISDFLPKQGVLCPNFINHD